MKKLLSCLLALTLSAPAFADSVSIAVGQPGFYGRIDIGDAPRPLLIYPEPILIVQSVGVIGPPIYLHVPPGHARHWRDHCHSYGACGRRVYFVQDGWYDDVYVPHYRKHHGNKNKGKRGRGHGRD